MAGLPQSAGFVGRANAYLTESGIILIYSTREDVQCFILKPIFVTINN